MTEASGYTENPASTSRATRTPTYGLARTSRKTRTRRAGRAVRLLLPDEQTPQRDQNWYDRPSRSGRPTSNGTATSAWLRERGEPDDCRLHRLRRLGVAHPRSGRRLGHQGTADRRCLYPSASQFAEFGPFMSAGSSTRPSYRLCWPASGCRPTTHRFRRHRRTSRNMSTHRPMPVRVTATPRANGERCTDRSTRRRRHRQPRRHPPRERQRGRPSTFRAVVRRGRLGVVE